MNASVCTPEAESDSDKSLFDLVDPIPQRGGVHKIVDGGRLGPFCVLTDGSLGSFYFEGKTMDQWEDSSIDQFLCIRRSLDGGISWTDAERVFQFPPMRGSIKITDLDLVPLLDTEGTLHVYCFNMLNWDERFSYSERIIELLHLFSKDNGLTWDGPVRIDYGHKYTGSLNAITQLSSGRIVLPFSYLQEGTFICAAILSDDNGYTWTCSRSDVPHCDDPALHLESGAMEPVTIEMEDDRVWMVIRTTNGRLFESWSSDGGETWTVAEPTPFRSSNAPAALVSLGGGRMLMAWNHCKGEPFVNGVCYARQSLVAAVRSEDGSWYGYREIAHLDPDDHPDHSVCYPWLVKLPNGRMLAGFLKVHLSRWKETLCFRLVTFDLDWLLASDSSADLLKFPEGFSATESGVSLADGKVLMKGAPLAGAGAGAVTWNFPRANSGKLTARLRLASPFGGAAITLSETFIKPSNFQEGVFRVKVEPDGKLFVQYANERPYEHLYNSSPLPLGKWFDFMIAWNCDRSSALVFVDGKAVGTLPKLEEGQGLSYIRLTALGEGGMEMSQIESKRH